MLPSLSSQWTLSLDLDDASIPDVPFADAIRIAGDAESGTVSAVGEAGDCLELEFDDSHALVWYMTAEKILLRPHCLNRPEGEQRIEEFFCHCCGVRLGPQEAYMSCGIGREEGFRLFRSVLESGVLPDTIPERQPAQEWLPGMTLLKEREALGRALEWRRCEPQGREHSEPEASGDGGRSTV